MQSQILLQVPFTKFCLLDRFIVSISKFRFFIVENCVFLGFFVAYENFIAHWSKAETISSLTESTPNEFFRVRRNDLILTAFSWTYYPTLIQRGTHFNAVWVNGEIISSLTGSTRKRFYRWLSQRGNDFIDDWVNGNIFPKITLQDRHTASQSELGVGHLWDPFFVHPVIPSLPFLSELLTMPIQPYWLVTIHIWAPCNV